VGADPSSPPRRLGVVEAFTVVTRSCPSGAVRSVAENALEAVKREGAKTLPEQAFLVLTACRGWQGDRATQVKESLRGFLDGVSDREAEGAHSCGRPSPSRPDLPSPGGQSRQ